MTWEEAQAIALKLPGAEPGSYHGYPAVRGRGRFLMRLADDPGDLEFKSLDPVERDLLVAARPDVFHVPAAPRGTAMVFAALDAASLQDVLDRRWRAVAPASLRRAGTQP